MNRQNLNPANLAASVEDRIHLAHARFQRGYGPLTGRLIGSGPRTIAARLRLVVDRYVALDMQRRDESFVVELDYPESSDADSWTPDTLPNGLILSRPGRDMVIPITWTTRTVTFGVSPLNAKPIVVALGGSEAGESLTGTVAHLVGAFFAGGVA